jgi:hypothetical protein
MGFKVHRFIGSRFNAFDVAAFRRSGFEMEAQVLKP